MRKLFISILLLLFACNGDKEVSELGQNLGILAYRGDKITISGKAVKGDIKNATVTISALKTDGTCDSNILANSITDDTGSYKIVYQKTGSNVCVAISPNSSGTTLMYDEKSGKDVAISPLSKFRLENIVRESSLQNQGKIGLLVSPFSRMLTKRVQVLAKQAGSNPDFNTITKKASKEIVIRFGLSSGFGSIKSTRALSDDDYPELDDILIDLEKPSSEISKKFLSILVGFSQLANKNKQGNDLSIDDLDDIMNAFAEDMSDGIFDGKNSDGKIITFGLNKTLLGNNSLTNILFPAIVEYIQQGGKLGTGSGIPATITVTQLTNGVKFEDSSTIASAINFDNKPTSTPIPTPINLPFTFSYSGTPFTFTQNSVLTTITPTTNGSITSCTVTPSLPTGIILSPTCVITGTPTGILASTSYTVTATNTSGGTANTTIAITVGVATSISYLGSPFTFVQNSAIVSTPPVVSGTTVSGCTSSPTLPAGLSLSSTCVITGTPSSLQGSINYTVTATGSTGNISTTISIAVIVDTIASSLSTSAALYNAASINDLVKVTAAEFTTVTTNLSTALTGYNGTIDSNWATGVGGNQTYAYRSDFVHANTVTTLAASSYVVAFTFVPALNPANLFTCQLKYVQSGVLVNISNIYSGSTIAILDRQYFVLKRPNVQIPAAPVSYLALYSTSGIGTVSLVAHNYDYVAGNLSGSQSFTMGAAATSQYPSMQAQTSTTKNW